MGTSGSYGGSGGAWNGARQELGDLLSGGGASADDVLGPAAGAIDWDEGADAGDGADVQAQPSDGTPEAPGVGEIPLRGTAATPIRIAGGRGRGSGGGGAAGGGGARQGSGGRGRGGGTRRSRKRAASVGASVAAAGYALRSGDAQVLRKLGLDLAALVTLSPRQQAQRIIDALAGAAATIADGEIARASSSMIIWLLEADAPPTAAETVAFFATETVYQIMLSELGSEMRDGSRDGAGTIVTEDEIHDVIEARVASLKIEGDSVDADALEGAIGEVLEFTRRVLFERPAA
jgi:hypothetical protein